MTFGPSSPTTTNTNSRSACNAAGIILNHSTRTFWICLCITVALSSGPASQRVDASSSGLNNIPTADTAPNLTMVLQGYSLFGVQRSPDHFAAFKFGIDPRETRTWRNRFEWGLDSRVAPGDIGPSVFQAKWATQPSPRWPAISIGIANLGSTTRRASSSWSTVLVHRYFSRIEVLPVARRLCPPAWEQQYGNAGAGQTVPCVPLRIHPSHRCPPNRAPAKLGGEFWRTLFSLPVFCGRVLDHPTDPPPPPRFHR